MAKTNNSDATGRSLEYAIVDEFLKGSNIEIDNSTENDQKRDKLKFDSLDSGLQNRYLKASVKIVDWCFTTNGIPKGSPMKLRRLTDDEAKQGNVSDIEVIHDEVKYNYSIKHNHTALKHQRPGALPQQCGIDKGTEEDKQYRTEYKNVTQSFLNSAKVLKSNAEKFNELKEVDVSFIDDNLYKPVCDLVCNWMNKWGSNPYNAEYFFRFVVGSTNYDKLVVYNGSVEISEFSDVPAPSKMAVSYTHLRAHET